MISLPFVFLSGDLKVFDTVFQCSACSDREYSSLTYLMLCGQFSERDGSCDPKRPKGWGIERGTMIDNY